MTLRTSIKRSALQGRAIGGVTLGDLPDMTRAQLCDTWAQVVGKPMIHSASRELLVNAIAWHLQARQHGGLTPAVQRKLERLAAAIDRGVPVRALTASERLRPGMSLERAWRGETHSVTVLAGGFAYRGQRYLSLSQIARRITGTRWNGPAFFGLRHSNGKASVGSDDAA
jgi:Protein of unknown function (DUF2924)